jgi:arylsulfatase A-like enzyme
LITIDTWRRDHLSAVDSTSPPTPNLDALAAEGIVFTNAWAPSPWTLPSLAALQTGLPPRVMSVTKRPPLPSRPPRLAQLAWQSGWNTAAFVTNPYLLDAYLLDRGFAVYRHAGTLPALEPVERSLLACEITRGVNIRRERDRAADIVPPAIAWLRREGADSPFFLWLHLLDPHLPYNWRELPAAPPPGARGRAPSRDEVPAGHPHFPDGVFSAVGQVRKGMFVPDALERRAIAALYAREVQYADAWLGRLFAELRALGVWDRSLIVVTADHGEELFDHGGFEHGHSLMPEVTGVPLIVKLPAGEGAGRRLALPVSLLDLAPTLCARFGWPLPDVPGLDLGPLLDGKEELQGAVARIQVIENMLYGPAQLAWLSWPWLRVGPPDSAGLWFDLQRDPFAAVSLPPPAEATAIEVEVLRRLAGWDREAAALREKAGVAVPRLSPELKQRLEALGY